MFLLCMDDEVVGKPFYIMEFMQGRIFKDPALPECEPAERRALWFALIDALAAVHNVDFVAVGLGDFGRQGGYFKRQTTSLSKVSAAQLAVDPEEVPEIPDFDLLANMLRQLQPKDAVSIVHGVCPSQRVTPVLLNAAVLQGISKWTIASSTRQSLV